jgi:hypothetical protein
MPVIERIPKLNIRPKHLIKIYSIPLEGPFDLPTFDQNITSLINSIADAQPIGGAQSVTVTSERDLYIWRELNYDTLGRIMEVYPSLGEFSVSVSKVAFFKEHLLDAFKAVEYGDVFSGENNLDKLSASFNIYNQIAPIHIVVELLGNESKNNSPVTNKVLIYDCWFDKSEIEFDVTEDNLLIIQSATLTAAGITAI